MVLGFGTASGVRGGARGSRVGDPDRRPAVAPRGRGRLRSALVVAELTLTVVLLVGAGLLLRSYANVLAVDPGFDPHDLLVVETSLPPSKYADTDRRSAFYSSVRDRVTAIPGVTAAGFANFPPLVFKGGRAFIAAEGDPPPAPQDIVAEHGDRPRRQPRLFPRARSADRARTRLRCARRAVDACRWPSSTGRWPTAAGPVRIRSAGGSSSVRPTLRVSWMTVVGVVGDIHEMALDSRVEPEVYLPANQGGSVPPFLWPQYLVVRTAGDPLARRGGSPPGDLERGPRAGGLEHPDDGRHLRRRTAEPQHPAHAGRRVCAAGVRDGGDRPVWRACVHGRAAPAGNRRSRGARRRPLDGGRRDAARRDGAGRRRDRARPGHRRSPSAARCRHGCSR